MTAYQNDLKEIESVKQFYTTYAEAVLQWNVAVEVVRISLLISVFSSRNREMSSQSHSVHQRRKVDLWHLLLLK